MSLRKLAWQIFWKTLRLGWKVRKVIPRKLYLFIALTVRFLAKYFCPNSFYLIKTQHYKMYLHYSDVGISAQSLLDGTYEECVTSLVKQITKGGMICADLGAHVGYYTLLMASLVGENGRVFAFEPAPDNYTLLLKNVEANGYKNVIPLQKAVSDQSGTIQLFLSENTRSHTVLDTRDNRKKMIAVSAVSLDDFFENKDCPDLIKIDIEGAEMKALRGMSKLIRRSDNLKLIVEVHTKGLEMAGSSSAEFVRELIKYNFMLYILEEPRTVRPVDEAEIIKICKRRESIALFCEKKRLP